MASEREKYYRRLNREAERRALRRNAAVALAVLAALTAGLVWFWRRHPRAAWMTAAALGIGGGAWWLLRGG